MSNKKATGLRNNTILKPWPGELADVWRGALGTPTIAVIKFESCCLAVRHHGVEGDGSQGWDAGEHGRFSAAFLKLPPLGKHSAEMYASAPGRTHWASSL